MQSVYMLLYWVAENGIEFQTPVLHEDNTA